MSRPARRPRTVGPSRPGEFGRGWRILASGIVGMAVQAFAFVSVGTMLVPLTEEFGWNRTEIVVVISFSAVLSIVFNPLVGRLIDRHGPRRVALAGFMMQPLALAAAGLAGPGIYSWWAIWVAITIATYCVGAPIWAYAVTVSFSRRRGLALGVILSGMGIANALVPLLLAIVIDETGWRYAYFTLAGLAALLGLGTTYALFKLPAPLREETPESSRPAPEIASGVTLAESVRTSRFWRLGLMLLLGAMAVGTLNLHFQAMLIDRHVTMLEAASLAALFGPAQIVGRLSGGFLLDRISGPVLGCIAFFFPFVSCLLLLNGAVAGPLGLLVPVLAGYAAGVELDLGTYFTGRYFGTRNFGGIFSAIFVFFTIGYTVGPLLAACIRDLTANYELVLVALVLILPVAALLSATMGRYTYPAGEDA